MKPNFLIFVTDQHRADHLGCYGNRTVKTPNIDALAHRGYRFDRAYVANPVCMPNRGSMMTGRMPTVHGARSNGVPLPLDAVTFADVLSEFGYRTALIGKCHLQNMEDAAALLPPQKIDVGLTSAKGHPQATRDARASVLYEQEMQGSWANPAHEFTLPYYGFQDMVLCNGHGDECFGDYTRWLEANHPDVAGRVGREHGARDPAYCAPQAWRTPLSEDQYTTHFIAEQTCVWLRKRNQTEPDLPFAVMCSFPDPHHPWTPPGKYWDMYDPQQMPEPPQSEARTPMEQWLIAERDAGKASRQGARIFAPTAREIREIMALTYGMITNIDDRIGMVMQTLQDCGVADNTVVIFVSDHGDLMGDHNAMLKGPMHYQGLVRVPFIWSEPGGGAGGQMVVRDDLVSSIDLASTILGRAGIAPPNGNQGTALFGPDGQPRPSGRRAVLIEENQQRAYLGFDKPVQVRTLVTKSHRMSVFQDDAYGELYDLVADPHEMHNLWSLAEHQTLRCELLDAMVRQLIAHAETSPRPTRVA